MSLTEIAKLSRDYALRTALIQDGMPDNIVDCLRCIGGGLRHKSKMVIGLTAMAVNMAPHGARTRLREQFTNGMPFDLRAMAYVGSGSVNTVYRFGSESSMALLVKSIGLPSMAEALDYIEIQLQNLETSRSIFEGVPDLILPEDYAVFRSELGYHPFFLRPFVGDTMRDIFRIDKDEFAQMCAGSPLMLRQSQRLRDALEKNGHEILKYGLDLKGEKNLIVTGSKDKPGKLLLLDPHPIVSCSQAHKADLRHRLDYLSDMIGNTRGQ